MPRKYYAAQLLSNAAQLLCHAAQLLRNAAQILCYAAPLLCNAMRLCNKCAAAPDNIDFIFTVQD